jgi:hypothetical protein
LTINSKNKAILSDIFFDPVRSNVKWSDIETLVVALGGEVTSGNGSRVRFYLNSIIATFHRPHPKKETDKGALKSVRRFLKEAGVNP